MEGFSPTAATSEVMSEIGRRLQRYRLQQNRTLRQIAAAAGISERTALRTEAGENPTLETLVRVLRALGRLDTLDALFPPPLVSPLQLADNRGRLRQRARTTRQRPKR